MKIHSYKSLDPEQAVMQLITRAEEQTQKRIKDKSIEVERLHAVLNSAMNLASIFSEKPHTNTLDFSNNREVREQLNQLFTHNPEWIAEFHQNTFNENELQAIKSAFTKQKLDAIDPRVYCFHKDQFSKIKYMLIYIEKSTSTKLKGVVNESHQFTEELTLLLKTGNETIRRRDQFIKHVLSK